MIVEVVRDLSVVHDEPDAIVDPENGIVATPEKVYVVGFRKIDLRELKKLQDEITRLSRIRDTHQLREDGSCEICNADPDDAMVKGCIGF